MVISYKFYVFGLVVVILITATVRYYSRPIEPGVSREFAEKRIKEILADSTKAYMRPNIILVNSEEAAVGIAEHILFTFMAKEKF